MSPEQMKPRQPASPTAVVLFVLAVMLRTALDTIRARLPRRAAK